MTALRVSCLQIEPCPPEVDAGTYANDVCELVRTAASAGAELVVLPELWHVGYFAFDNYEREATSLDGPLPRQLSELTAELGITLHVGSLLERQERLMNTSIVYGPDGCELGVYRKVHVFGYGSRERELIQGGNEATTARLEGATAGLAICYDLRFPELFRATVDDVSLYIIPATWPAVRVEAWSALLRARAIENIAVVIGCNAAGTNGGVALGGRSAVISPWGEIIAEAGTQPGRLDAMVDLDAVARTRDEFPALRDRLWPAIPSSPTRSEP